MKKIIVPIRLLITAIIALGSAFITSHAFAQEPNRIARVQQFLLEKYDTKFQQHYPTFEAFIRMLQNKLKEPNPNFTKLLTQYAQSNGISVTEFTTSLQHLPYEPEKQLLNQVRDFLFTKYNESASLKTAHGTFANFLKFFLDKTQEKNNANITKLLNLYAEKINSSQTQFIDALKKIYAQEIQPLTAQPAPTPLTQPQNVPSAPQALSNEDKKLIFETLYTQFAQTTSRMERLAQEGMRPAQLPTMTQYIREYIFTDPNQKFVQKITQQLPNLAPGRIKQYLEELLAEPQKLEDFVAEKMYAGKMPQHAFRRIVPVEEFQNLATTQEDINKISYIMSTIQNWYLGAQQLRQTFGQQPFPSLHAYIKEQLVGNQDALNFFVKNIPQTPARTLENFMSYLAQNPREVALWEKPTTPQAPIPETAPRPLPSIPTPTKTPQPTKQAPNAENMSLLQKQLEARRQFIASEEEEPEEEYWMPTPPPQPTQQEQKQPRVPATTQEITQVFAEKIPAQQQNLEYFIGKNAQNIRNKAMKTRMLNDETVWEIENELEAAFGRDLSTDQLVSFLVDLYHNYGTPSFNKKYETLSPEAKKYLDELFLHVKEVAK